MGLILCPECNAEVSAGAKTCVSCGYKLKKFVKNHKPCVECKHGIKLAAKKCDACGAEQPKKKESVVVVVALFLLVVPMVMIVFSAFVEVVSNPYGSTFAGKAPAKAKAPTSAGYICKAAIATAMYKDVDIIRLDYKGNNNYHLSYIRPQDNTRWGFKCKFQGRNIIIATDGRNNTNGRWRDRPEDEQLSYSIANNILTIKSRYAGENNYEKYPMP